MNEEFAEYVKYALECKERYPEWRIGQAYYNALVTHRWDLAHRVCEDTDLDPYHTDDHERVGKFLEWVQQEWER